MTTKPDRMRLRWHLVSAQEQLNKLSYQALFDTSVDELRAQCDHLNAELRQVERALWGDAS